MTSAPRMAPGAVRSLAGRLLGAAGSLAMLAVFIAAVFFLHHELRSLKLSDIEDSLAKLGWGPLVKAALLTATSYLLLTGYDWLALRYIGRSLPYPQIALASFVSYVCGYNFGAILGGTTMRYRLYSTFGLSAVEIVKVIAFCTLTFILGFCTLAGAVFVLNPLPLPEFASLPIKTVSPIGTVLLAGVAVYSIASALARRGIVIRGWELSLPPFHFTVPQMVVATADLIAAASVLYCLLPAGIEVEFFYFVGIFLLAQFLGIISHVPGGLGVVEGVLLYMLAPDDKSALVASMLAYRITYYLAPLAVAMSLLAIHEGFQQRAAVARFATMFGRWGPLVVPPMLAVTTFSGGAVLVMSSALPRTFGRWSWAAEQLPLSLIEIAHFGGALLGVGLMVVARGLQQRLSTAYRLSVAMLAAGVAFALLRGFDVEEALIVGAMLAMLIPCRQYFYRRVSLASEPFTIGWITATILVLIGAIWIGFFVSKEAAYSHGLWWEMSHGGDISRMLRAGVGIFFVLLVAALARVARGARGSARPPDPAELAAAAAILDRTPRATPAPPLAELSLRMNQARTAMVLYVTRRSSWISLGDPLGPQSERAELAWQFRELCDSRGGWPVFYQISADLLPLYVDLGLMVLQLGDEAIVPLPDFDLEGPHRALLRAAHEHAKAAGCTFDVTPQPATSAILLECRQLRNTWQTHPSSALWDAAEARGCPLAIVRQSGEIVAIGPVWQGADRSELSLEPACCAPNAPAFVLAYLLTEAMLWGRSAGFHQFNLGLAKHAGEAAGPLEPLWKAAGTSSMRYGDHFDSVAQAREYLMLFAPQWSPTFLATPGGRKLSQVTTDLAWMLSERHGARAPIKA
jgi:phosphatidylglycerol lysyltransferase